eukprot:332161_1
MMMEEHCRKGRRSSARRASVPRTSVLDDGLMERMRRNSEIVCQSFGCVVNHVTIVTPPQSAPCVSNPQSFAVTVPSTICEQTDDDYEDDEPIEGHHVTIVTLPQSAPCVSNPESFVVTVPSIIREQTDDDYEDDEPPNEFIHSEDPMKGNFVGSSFFDQCDMVLHELENHEQNKIDLERERQAYWRYFCNKELWILLLLMTMILIGAYCVIKYVTKIDATWNMYLVIMAIALCIVILWLLHMFLVHYYDKSKYSQMQHWNRLRFEDKMKQSVYYWYGSREIPDDIANSVVKYIGNETLKRNRSLVERMRRRDTSKKRVYLCICCC